MNDFPEKIKLQEEVLVQEIDGSTILLNLQSEHYYGLNDVGARIWEVLSEQPDVKIAFEKLLQEYDVNPDVLKSDMLNLITELAKAKLISVS